MSRLGGLVATALVGVARRPPSGAEQIGNHIVQGRTARAVLDAACLHAVARRAGHRAFADQATGADETVADFGPDLSPAPDNASQLLDLLLTGSLGKAPQTAALIGYWVHCAAARGYRAPHHLLVPLLGRPLPGLVADSTVAPDLVAVLGSRGRWLAELNPEWRKVADGLPGTASDGSSSAGPADEWLLGHRPDSAWVQDKTALLRTLVRVEGRVRKRLVVELPDADEVADLGSAPPGTSVRAHGLTTLVSMAPLGWWTELTGWNPTALAKHVGDQPELKDGWVQAAIRQRDLDWAEALLGQNPDPGLVPVLGDDRAEPLIRRKLHYRGSLPAVQLALALGGGTEPWTPGLSQAVVRCLRGENFEIQILQQSAVELGNRLDSSVIDELQRWHDQHKAKQYFVATLLRDIIKHISTRTAITAAFANQTVPTNQTMREDR